MRDIYTLKVVISSSGRILICRHHYDCSGRFLGAVINKTKRIPAKCHKAKRPKSIVLLKENIQPRKTGIGLLFLRLSVFFLCHW